MHKLYEIVDEQITETPDVSDFKFDLKPTMLRKATPMPFHVEETPSLMASEKKRTTVSKVVAPREKMVLRSSSILAPR